MKAVLMEGFGGVEVLKVGEAEKPSPGEGQVLVKVYATTVNRPDLVQREGKYPPPPGDSEILGLEVAGVIEELGAGVSGWKVGDRVMTLVGGGGYAEYAVAYAAHLMPIPESMSFEEAACVCESYITAFLNVFMIGELKDKQTAILHGGGGGVNTAGIQIAKYLGAQVIVVGSDVNKLKLAESIGADVLIDRSKMEDWSKAVFLATNKRGVDAVVDNVGTTFMQSLRALRKGGRLLTVGNSGSPKFEIDKHRDFIPIRFIHCPQDVVSVVPIGVENLRVMDQGQVCRVECV